MVVDVSVTVWAADAHDYEAFELAVLPRARSDLRRREGQLEREPAPGAATDPVESLVIRFPLRVEAPSARVAALTTKQRVQQAMRDVGVRGVVSVLDGWPVGDDAA